MTYTSLGWKCERCGGFMTTEGVYLFARIGSEVVRFDQALNDPRIQAIIAQRMICVVCATCGRASEVAQDVVEALR